ncbi:unnamed protein product [Urochloa humidicola]
MLNHLINFGACLLSVGFGEAVTCSAVRRPFAGCPLPLVIVGTREALICVPKCVDEATEAQGSPADWDSGYVQRNRQTLLHPRSTRSTKRR